MGKSRKHDIWNKRKGEEQKSDNEYSEDDFMDGDGGEQNEMIDRIQYRLGVSRDEAKRIIRNSELI